MRNYSVFDRLIQQFDSGLRTMALPSTTCTRPYPAEQIDSSDPSEAVSQKKSGRLMRVNHAGEIAAQGLYHGQALTARNETIRNEFRTAAREEQDHLAWCQQRLNELNTSRSLLSPVWYLGSLMIGAGAGISGDRWSLGFVIETENQVEKHLTGHLEKLPANDLKSRAVVEQMRADEVRHASNAQSLGGAPLPKPIAFAMSAVAKVMTGSAYWI